MEQILELIVKFGLPVFVIAFISIIIIGILKLCKVFRKVTDQNVRKVIYYSLNIVLSFGGAAIYFAAFGITFDGYIMFCLTQLSATTTLYAIYENLGVRKFCQYCTSAIISKLTKSSELKFIEAAKSLGINQSVIETFLINLHLGDAKQPAPSSDVRVVTSNNPELK